MSTGRAGSGARRRLQCATCRRRAFTLFELILVIVIVALIGMIALPELQGSANIRLTTAANALAADIEFCENECITHPDTLYVICFSSSSNRYWIALASSPTVPISHPEDALPYQNDFLTGRNVQLTGVSLSSVSIGAGLTTLSPDAYGCPGLASDATITLSNGTLKITLTVNASTGDVSIAGAVPGP